MAWHRPEKWGNEGSAWGLDPTRTRTLGPITFDHICSGGNQHTGMLKMHEYFHLRFWGFLGRLSFPRKGAKRAEMGCFVKLADC